MAHITFEIRVKDMLYEDTLKTLHDIISDLLFLIKHQDEFDRDENFEEFAEHLVEQLENTLNKIIVLEPTINNYDDDDEDEDDDYFDDEDK